MITVADFDFTFEAIPYELLVTISFGPEREAWRKAIHSSVYTQWVDIARECNNVLEDWMYEHGINYKYRTFLQADVKEIIIDNLEEYTYMKLFRG